MFQREFGQYVTSRQNFTHLHNGIGSENFLFNLGFNTRASNSCKISHGVFCRNCLSSTRFPRYYDWLILVFSVKRNRIPYRYCGIITLNDWTLIMFYVLLVDLRPLLIIILQAGSDHGTVSYRSGFWIRASCIIVLRNLFSCRVPLLVSLVLRGQDSNPQRTKREADGPLPLNWQAQPLAEKIGKTVRSNFYV